MSEVKRVRELPCTTCDGILFTPIMKVVRHPNGGIADNPQGRVCAHCGTILNTGAAWAKLELQAQRDRLKSMQEAGELELEGLLRDSARQAVGAGEGLENLMDVSEKGKRPLKRGDTALGKELDLPDES